VNEKRKRERTTSGGHTHPTRIFLGEAQKKAFFSSSTSSAGLFNSVPMAVPARVRCRGGAKGIRTPDLLIANETLYQLSYSPKSLTISELRVISQSPKISL
jgi:hypothetical protein